MDMHKWTDDPDDVGKPLPPPLPQVTPLQTGRGAGPSLPSARRGSWRPKAPRVMVPLFVGQPVDKR